MTQYIALHRPYIAGYKPDHRYAISIFDARRKSRMRTFEFPLTFAPLSAGSGQEGTWRETIKVSLLRAQKNRAGRKNAYWVWVEITGSPGSPDFPRPIQQ